ncbi:MULTISPECIES: hypothetical protein [unclassified Leucobacter]|uniref:hypothetical protein n=1 Tax=unclassified Leucobacter TaxID=2621730 RepID=UPI00301ADD5F
MSRQNIPKGRPSKGKRDAILAKPPLEFGKILKQQAEELGYESYGDYMVALAAQSLNMPEFSPHPRGERVSEFPNRREARPRAA